jgi:hypothetical protein
LHEPTNEAVKEPLFIVADPRTNRDSLSNDILEFDNGVGRQQVKFKGKELRDGLLPAHTPEQQHIFAKGSINGDEPIGLYVGGHALPSLSLG